MTSKATLALLIPFALVVPSEAQIPKTEAEAAANRARPFIEGKAAIERQRNSDHWNVPLAATIERYIQTLKKDCSDWNDLSGGGRYFTEIAATAKDRLSELSFEYAELALKRNQLTVADSVYRDLISFFVGSTYSGIRERAKIGLDDVREAKKALELPPPPPLRVIAPPPVTPVLAPFDLKSELEKLNKMRKDKLITEAEYKELRKVAIEKAKSK